MKIFLICLMFVTLYCLSVVDASNCITENDACEEDECCVQIVPTVGACKKLQAEDDLCDMRPLKHSIRKNVFKGRCPCGEGMFCSAKDRNAALGNCVEYENEEPADE